MSRFLLLLLIPTLLYAELLHVTTENIEKSPELYDEFEIVSFITNSSALVIGSSTNHSTIFKSTVLEKEWDANSNYFLLLKRGGYANRKTIHPHAVVLFESPSYFIVKSTNPILNEISDFSRYDIIGLQRHETQRSRTFTKQLVPFSTEHSETIDSIVQSVNSDSIWQRIAELQNLERYTYAAGVSQSVSHFESYLTGLSFDTLYTDNYLGNGAPNIIIEKEGKKSPDEIILICAHYDVTKSGYPGADDNGSGSAGALEIARVISDLSFNKTVRLVWFSGEEISLLGSKDYATKAYNAGDNITAVFNLDMIGYLKAGDPLQLDVGYNASSKALFDTFTALAKLYVPQAPIKDCKNSQWINSSDHKSFWDKGYPALYFGDDLDPYGPENPHYHKLSDTLSAGVNSKDYLSGVTKTVTASLLTLAEIWQDTDILSTSHKTVNCFTIIQKAKALTISENSAFDSNSTLRLINPMGKVLKEKQFIKSIHLNLSDLSSGRYILIIENGTERFERQIKLQ